LLIKTNSLCGIVMATRLEAAPFIDSGLFACLEKKPFPVYQSNNFILILSGIGKAASAIASTLLITKYDREIMFNIGAAGSTTENISAGEIFHINAVIDYDRPSLAGNKPRYLTPCVLPDYQTSVLATQDVAVVSRKERKKVGQMASLVDMEGAAFVQACTIFDKKNYLFKIVTDTPAHTTDRDIIENIKKTREKLFVFFKKEFILQSEKIHL